MRFFICHKNPRKSSPCPTLGFNSAHTSETEFILCTPTGGSIWIWICSFPPHLPVRPIAEIDSFEHETYRNWKRGPNSKNADARRVTRQRNRTESKPKSCGRRNAETGFDPVLRAKRFVFFFLFSLFFYGTINIIAVFIGCVGARAYTVGHNNSNIIGRTPNARGGLMTTSG